MRLPFGRFPLRLKFMGIFVVLITIPLLVIGSFTYSKYAEDVEDNAQSHTYQLVDQIRINLERYFKEMERLTLAPLYDQSVLEILKRHSGPYQDKGIYIPIEQEQKLNLFLSSMSFDRSEIKSILIFMLDGNLLNNAEVNVRGYWEEKEQQWMQAVYDQDGGLTVLPIHEVFYYSGQSQSVVSLSRLIREPFTHQILGIIKVDLTQEGLERVFSTATFGDDSRLSIVDKSGAQVYLRGTDELPNNKSSRYLTSAVESPYTGLQIVMSLPAEQLQAEAKQLIRFSVIVTFGALTLAYVLAIWLANRLVRPIHHLQSKMSLVRKGFFKERAHVLTRDEVGQLTIDFNAMVGEVDRLVNAVYELEIRQRDAELSALQSQLNPHFLYNTLEQINMMAVKAGNLSVSGVVSDLGALLRYTVDNRRAIVRLGEEIVFVESYLSIQSLRLGSLRTELNVDPSLHNALVPKLILQPLMENAIEHGGAERGNVTIRVDIRLEQDDLAIDVEDDGTGMDEQTIRDVERRMTADHDAPEDRTGGVRQRGFALRNIHQRIRIMYGEPYGIRIVPRQEGGLIIQIRLPFRWQEE